MANQLTPNLLFHVRIVEGVQAISYNKKTYSKLLYVFWFTIYLKSKPSGSIPHKKGLL